MPSRPVRIISPYPFTHQFRIKPIDAGATLLAFFAQKFPFKTVDEWQGKIHSAHVRVNGLVITPEYVLKSGDEISHFNPSVVEPTVPDEIEILQETSNWLAVNKPAPMPMHSGGRYHKNTLKSILEERLQTELFITHRLDAVTSGLVLLAKSEQFAEKISEAFRLDKVEKEYQALVYGNPTDDFWAVHKGIRRKEGFVFECSDEPNAKPAFTQFEVIQRFGDKTLVRCLPKTGRTHQLRLHLACSGFPIVDDDVYQNLNHPNQAQFLQKKAVYLCNTHLNFTDLGIQLTCVLPHWWF